MDAKLAASEARAETKFVQLLGKLDLVVERLGEIRKDVSDLDTKIGAVDDNTKSAKTLVITTIIGTAIGVAGLAYAAVAIFQGGMGLSATAYQSGMSAAEAKKK
ncbi:hypothetical protein [Novosphingobium sp. ZW T3_23]|uniref:hypothetical protein n=1 Tax=Novosphingobium sp. ZW T3_23 TaxID=3378084 RepID=UPI0038545E1D